MSDRYMKQIQVEHDINTMLICIEDLIYAWRTDPVGHEYVQQNKKDIGQAHLLLGLLMSVMNQSQTTREVSRMPTNAQAKEETKPCA